MLGHEYVFQMSGQRDLQQKAELLQAIRELQGHYIGGSVGVYKEMTFGRHLYPQIVLTDS